uniref:Uncharacterized protein n=1 Tax=Caenorhabditis japonica TaxID=281687 RepID=A0A8R1HQD3_CAEJA
MMISPRNIAIFLSVAFLIHYATSAKQAVVSKKSKLCGNAACEEVLFKSRVKRVMGVNDDPNFLNLVENAFIAVVAVKFSDRPDIMEGRLNGEGAKGFFYAGAIDTMPFAEFLRTAIDEKKEMLMISQNPGDVGDNRIVGVLHSETDLIRDFNAKNAQAAAEHGLPAPEPLPIPEPTGGHGHSHGGHGHSHGGHGHSHGHPAPTPAPAPAVTPPPTVAEPAVEATTEAPKTPETVAEDTKAEINLNSVLGSPPVLPAADKLDLGDMDAEIERMIREEQERMSQGAQEVTQPPLVLSSAPVEQEPEVVTPAPISEAVPAAETVPEATTPIPVPVAQEIVAEPKEVTTPAPVQEPVAQEPVNPQPVVQEPVVQEPIAQYIPPPPAETVTPAPIVEEITTPPPLQAEEVTGFCYKDECDGLQTTPPPTPVEPAVTEPPVIEQPPAAAQTQEDEDFQKWEEERKKREVEAEAKPYEDSQTAHHFHDLPTIPPKSSAILDFIRSTFGLGNITDASVILYMNITFVAASLLLYLIVRSLSSFSDSDVLDRQAYFNVVTKYKQLEVELQNKNSEIQNLQSAGIQQQQQQPQPQIPNHEPELLALRQQVNQLHAELQIAQSQRQEFELHFNQLREISEQKEQQLGTLNQTIAEYQDRLEKSSGEVQEYARQLDSARSELNESQQTAFTRQQELVQQQQEHDSTQQKIQELTSEARTLTTRISQLEQANDELEIELKELKLVNEGLHETVQQLEKSLEKSQNESGSAAESGGSGWSDFGDVDDVDEKKEEKTPDASHIELADYRAKYKKYGQDMEELAALKVKFEEVEKELNRYKSLADKEERGKTDIEQRLKNAQTDVAEAKKKVEEIAAEKKELGDRLNETVKTLNNTINKSSDADKIVANLREEGFGKEKKLLEVEGELRKKDDKIRELDAEFKRVQREYTKLETKSFHDVMKLKKELDEYKTSQLLGGQNISRDMFNSSDLRPSSDRLGERDRQLGSPLDDPIWDEPEYVPNHQMPPLQQEDYFSSGSMTMPSKRRSSRRSDHRLLAGMGGELSPSDREEKKSKTAPSRRRSRSHGRQMPAYNDPYAMPYMPGSSDSSFMSHHAPGFQPLSGRHSKSGHLVYSSGGSNGGRSPPPEMPLLSAIPPPGARKPTSKRAGRLTFIAGIYNALHR